MTSGGLPAEHSPPTLWKSHFMFFGSKSDPIRMWWYWQYIVYRLAQST